MVDNLDYEDIEFPVSKKDFGKIEKKNNICINVFSLCFVILINVYGIFTFSTLGSISQYGTLQIIYDLAGSKQFSITIKIN